MRYWLMKSEPDVFGIDHLAKRKHQTEHWDGVRNYQVRNMIRDVIKSGDRAFFYHSSCAVPGIAGVIRIVSDGYPDSSALEPSNEHYDPKSTAANPRWYMVDVQLEHKFDRVISLQTLRQHPALAKMPILQRGNRLSITPVSPVEWKFILKLARQHD
ncbi:MAG: EVE domain-containing protein [Gammaproteobacteria bacterium]|nr:EVE domain-containing protein [Gammaproteobacteria bacterium]